MKTRPNLAATPISLDYSSDSGSTWSSIATGLANSGTYSWTVPSVNINTAKVRLTAIDSVGNSAQVASSTSLIIDSGLPTISAFTLNGGAATSATNFLTANVTGTDSFTGVNAVNFTLNSTPPTAASSGWQAYAGGGTNITYIAPFGTATRTIYAWLKDVAGNVSSSLSTSITITIGAPPVATFINPNGSLIYATENTVHVDWTVTSTVGLAASNPIELDYSINAGSLVAISSTLSNIANAGCTIGGGGGGTVANPLTTSATNRLTEKFTSVSAEAISNLAFDSQNRLIFSVFIYNAGGTDAGLVVYRVNTDDTLEIIAGDFSLNNPVSENDTRTSGLGDAVVSFSVFGKIARDKGSPDILYIAANDFKVYALNLATYSITYLAAMNGPSALVYEPIRDRLIWSTGTGLSFVRTDTGATDLTIDNSEISPQCRGVGVDASGVSSQR